MSGHRRERLYGLGQIEPNTRVKHQARRDLLEAACLTFASHNHSGTEMLAFAATAGVSLTGRSHILR